MPNSVTRPSAIDADQGSKTWSSCAPCQSLGRRRRALRFGAGRPAVIALLRRIIAPYPLPQPRLWPGIGMLEGELERQQALLQAVKPTRLDLLQLLDNCRGSREVFGPEPCQFCPDPC